MNNDKNLQIQSIRLDYKPELAKELYQTIEPLNWSMLLRSASTDHVDSRYDIVVANPVATITTTGAISTLVEPEGITQSFANPFEQLAYLQEKYVPSLDNTHDLPFVGGSLGYFAYDLGRCVEDLPTTAIHDISMPDMAVGIYTWAVVVDHHTQSAFLLGQQLDGVQRWLDDQARHYNHSKMSQPFSLTSEWHSNMSADDYSNKFFQVQDYLLSGDCYQINLTQRFSARYQGSEWQAYLALERENKAPFSAYIHLESGVIISLSPERFLQLRDGIIETKPIKGTRPRSHDEEIDKRNAKALKEASKDQAENLMIVDLLRNDIGRVARPGSVHVPALFEIESFPAVHHLVSTIRAELGHQYSSTDLLRACFPGGSITGAPKVRAMEIIEELEPHRRSVYCGSIGYISRDGQMDTSITIRTLIANKNKLYVWAGGGLVADSNVDEEYQETFDKLSQILPILT
jgi:para-aminobenzoate synthetase component I